MDEKTVLLSQDESHIRAYQALRAVWTLKGSEKKYLYLIKVNLFGTVDMQTGNMFCTSAEKCNAATFLHFLQELLTRYADKFVILIVSK
ncbi:transposase [Aneurinibacillus terranovensis]|uniref:transposase n=1 Tax=Aneurinibacillus terranovensis TaxID=278991 RepID=UPI00138AC72A